MGFSHLETANSLEPSVGHRVLREQHPLFREDAHHPPFWVISRHGDVLDVLKRAELWSNADGPGVFYQTGGVLGSADDPDHARQRQVLRDVFLPSRMRALEARLADILDELWSVFDEAGEGDFVSLFAFPFPAMAVAEVLGVDADDRDQFRVWADDIVAGLGGGDLNLVERANENLWSYIGDQVDRRLALIAAGEPLPDDAITTMTQAHLGGRLSRWEIQRLGHQLLVAGHETTASLIALALYRLANQPELADQLREDPGLLEGAIEEFLRFDSPVQGLFRTNTRSCPVRGVEIPEGTKLQVMFAAANRDPDIWEDPDSIRFDRDVRVSRQHLAFGWGTHFCIGAPLARLEARLALHRMVEHFGTVEVLEEPLTTPPFILRGFSELKVRWTVR